MGYLAIELADEVEEALEMDDTLEPAEALQEIVADRVSRMDLHNLVEYASNSPKSPGTWLGKWEPSTDGSFEGNIRSMGMSIIDQEVYDELKDRESI